MNNFNVVFSAVKEVCGKEGEITDPVCFKALTKTTKIQPHRLLFYLDTLESIGLIKYNADTGHIKLTDYGKMKEKVFAE